MIFLIINLMSLLKNAELIYFSIISSYIDTFRPRTLCPGDPGSPLTPTWCGIQYPCRRNQVLKCLHSNWRHTLQHFKLQHLLFLLCLLEVPCHPLVIEQCKSSFIFNSFIHEWKQNACSKNWVNTGGPGMCTVVCDSAPCAGGPGGPGGPRYPRSPCREKTSGYKYY